ncbi:YhdP family protein [Endozoicomonas sp.]|uniref:YhdP family protein n=1 Tax=Endozoicomonas sp. TaxID=1892382 RepID=UPI00383B45DC
MTILVVIVASGRLMFSSLPVLLPELSRFLSDRLNADFQIESMSAQWNSGDPSLSLRGLTLKGKEAEVTGFSIEQLDMELSLRESLLHWTPVFTALEIKGVNIDLVQGDGARWTLSGIQQIAGSSLQTPKYRQGSALEWLALQQMVDIRNIRLNLRKANGESSDINSRYLTVLTDDNRKELSARLEVGSGYLEVAGSGVFSGGLFSQWQGTGKASELNAEQLCALWSGCNDDILIAMVELDTQWRYDNESWQVQGEVAAPDVAYLDNSGSLSHLSGQSALFMQGVFSGAQESSWQIWLNDLQLENRLHNDVTYRWKNSWYLTGGRRSEYTITAATEDLDLDLLKRWLLDTNALPKPVADLVHTLNPEGQLNDLAIRFFPSRKPFDFDLSARLDNVSVDAWEGAPSGGNVSGQLRMNLLQGYLDLDSRDFQLGFPELFRETWTFDTARARLYWDVIDGFYILRSDDLALAGPEGDLKGKLRLDVPLQWNEGETLDMALTVGMSNGDARYTGKYLPALMPMDSDLVHWLDTAIRKADISGGGFIYNGALVGNNSPQDSRWGLFFDISNGELDYAPDWPIITGLTGQVYVNDDRVEVLAESAESAGGKLDNIIARVPLEGESVLKVSSHLNANGETLKYFLTQTPVNDLMEGEAKKWQLQGRLDAGLNLTLPLEDLESSEVDIRSAVKSFRFAIPELGIDVNDIDGDLSFSTERGLYARQLSGQLFGNPAQFQIRSTVVNQQPVTTDIDWTGKVSVTFLQDWLTLDWLSLLEGETDYRARFSLGLNEGTTELRVNSELLGVEIELPAPVGKPADAPLPLDLSLTKKGGHERLNVSLANLGQLQMTMTPEWSPESALVILGSASERISSGSQLPEGGKFVVTGVLPELDIGPWKQRFEGQPGTPGEQQLASQIEVDNVAIGSLIYGDYQWSDISVTLQQGVQQAAQRGGAQPDRKGMKLSVDGQRLQGDLWIPEQRTTPWKLNIDHVYLPESALAEAPSGEGTTEPVDSLADINPATLPSLDVSISRIQIGNRAPGRIGFKLRHAPHGIKVDNITGELSGVSLKGLADWVQMDGEQRSWVQGTLKGTGIKELQKALGFSGFLEAKESRFDASLNWEGSPIGGDVATMKGRVDLLLKKGRLRKVDSSSSGALKVFGIFNTEALARRVQLDFSDLYSSGISFDQIRGSLNVNQGVITFDSPMVIEGPSSDFKLDGTIDTNREELDLSLVVTLPVSSNLPILSVLLGTAPQVAGIIYIADKLVGKQVDQLASIRYRIKGPFDDPEMTLDKLFSNKLRK